MHDLNNPPEWAKTILADIAAARAASIQRQIEDRLKGVPELFYKHSQRPTEPQDVEAFCRQVKADFEAFQTTFQQEETTSTTADILKWAGKDPETPPANTSATEDDIIRWAKSHQ